MVMLSVVEASTHLIVSFFLAPVAASGLGSPVPVRAATTGRRQFRPRTTAATRGTSASIRAPTTRTTATSAIAGRLFVLSKGSHPHPFL